MQLKGSILNNLTNAMGIVQLLFEGDSRRMDKALEELVSANDRLNNTPPSAGFMFNGEFYMRANATKAPMHGERRVLHEDLWDQMMEYLKDVAALIMDVHMINQMTHRLVGKCQTEQDLRDALPDSMVMLSDTLNALPRTRPVAYTLEGDERAQRQFAKVKPLMDTYAATRLLF